MGKLPQSPKTELIPSAATVPRVLSSLSLSLFLHANPKCHKCTSKAVEEREEVGREGLHPWCLRWCFSFRASSLYCRAAVLVARQPQRHLQRREQLSIVFPPSLPPLPPLLSIFFLFSVSLSFSLLATRNRIKFAPWEFKLLFFKNDASSHLTPSLLLPLLLPFPLSRKEHRSPALSFSLSRVALELVSCVVIHSANCLLPALT